MITIFTTPKPFKGHINTIQRNAILSWKSVLPEAEIILFGSEEGIKETAEEFGISCVSEIKRNSFGTPLVDDIFEKAQKIAKNNILTYINADIILMSDFSRAIKQIDFSKFLLVGRRQDLDVKEEINFNNINWEEKLRKQIKEEGELHGLSGIDYFVFPKGFFGNIPPFALGRTAWDNWFLYKARSLKAPLIDATEVVTTVHQNHDYSHHKGGKKGVWTGEEARANLKSIGGNINLFTIRDANRILTSQGLKKPPFPRNIFSALSFFYPWRLILSIKRSLQKF